MKLATALIIPLSFFLAGCPLKMWLVQPDKEVTTRITEKCVRTLAKHEDIRGVVKLDWNGMEHDFERYLIETKFGVANLDIEEPSSTTPKVTLYLSGAGNEAPEPAKTKGKLLLDSIVKDLEAVCQNHS